MTTLYSDFTKLTDSQQDYFYHLAEGTNTRVLDFFEKVPAEIRSQPDLVEMYLNGDAELGISDKDWSHIVSKHNGGSNEATNGFFEDMSENRSRGADNVTPEEMYEAQQSDEEEVATLLESVEDVADASGWALAADAAAGAGELALDFLAPVVGGGLAAKLVVDRCDTLEEKVGYGSAAGIATAAVLCTPVGQACVAGYVGFKLAKRGIKLFNKHFANA